jgi:hypothetical protein
LSGRDKLKGKLGLVGMPVIPALRRLKQEYCKFQASLGYIAKPCLKKKANE